jgi:hypothetical protein
MILGARGFGDSRVGFNHILAPPGTLGDVVHCHVTLEGIEDELRLEFMACCAILNRMRPPSALR